MPGLKLRPCSKGAEWGPGEFLGNCVEEMEQSWVFFAVFHLGVRYLLVKHGWSDVCKLK